MSKNVYKICSFALLVLIGFFTCAFLMISIFLFFLRSEGISSREVKEYEYVSFRRVPDEESENLYIPKFGKMWIPSLQNLDGFISPPKYRGAWLSNPVNFEKISVIYDPKRYDYNGFVHHYLNSNQNEEIGDDNEAEDDEYLLEEDGLEIKLPDMEEDIGEHFFPTEPEDFDTYCLLLRGQILYECEYWCQDRETLRMVEGGEKFKIKAEDWEVVSSEEMAINFCHLYAIGWCYEESGLFEQDLRGRSRLVVTNIEVKRIESFAEQQLRLYGRVVDDEFDYYEDSRYYDPDDPFFKKVKEIDDRLDAERAKRKEEKEKEEEDGGDFDDDEEEEEENVVNKYARW